MSDSISLNLFRRSVTGRMLRAFINISIEWPNYIIILPSSRRTAGDAEMYPFTKDFRKHVLIDLYSAASASLRESVFDGGTSCAPCRHTFIHAFLI